MFKVVIHKCLIQLEFMAGTLFVLNYNGEGYHIILSAEIFIFLLIFMELYGIISKKLTIVVSCCVLRCFQAIGLLAISVIFSFMIDKKIGGNIVSFAIGSIILLIYCVFRIVLQLEIVKILRQINEDFYNDEVEKLYQSDNANQHIWNTILPKVLISFENNLPSTLVVN